MNEKKHVQYKNDPNGTKWELADGSYNESLVAPNWRVRAEDDFHYLPKSEYIPCEPPERWTDVTAECRVDGAASAKENGRLSILHRPANDIVSTDIFHPHSTMRYRVTKVQLFTSVDGQEVAGERWAFIVEKRED